MTALDALRRMGAEQGRNRPVLIGLAASLGWLVLILLLAWLVPEAEPAEGEGGFTTSLFWLLGVLLPLTLIWFAVWSARGLARLRLEAEELRATLAQMQAGAAPRAEWPQAGLDPGPSAPPRPVTPARPQPLARAAVPAPRPVPADAGQTALDLGMANAPELTPSELFLALNFPDGPEDREAIRCLRLALADPMLARLIRAAQDVVTLLAGQGVYMDDLAIRETDGRLWLRFAEGSRGEAVAGLAVIEDAAALDAAGDMLREDEVFRDVAHHFLRHFDRLLGQRVGQDDPQVLAALAETRSGRAFVLMAQATGILGAANSGAGA